MKVRINRNWLKNIFSGKSTRLGDMVQGFSKCSSKRPLFLLKNALRSVTMGFCLSMMNSRQILKILAKGLASLLNPKHGNFNKSPMADEKTAFSSLFSMVQCLANLLHWPPFYNGEVTSNIPCSFTMIGSEWTYTAGYLQSVSGIHCGLLLLLFSH